jgi:hypothetical protein
MAEVSSGQPAEVLSGQAGELSWVVTVEGDDADLRTMLRVCRGDQVVVPGSGFGGPGLYPGRLLNEWRGRTGDLPYFVMARTSPAVSRVVATTDRGLEVELALSGPAGPSGLRFAAAALPPGHAPASIRAEDGETVLETWPQPIPPAGRRPG